MYVERGKSKLDDVGAGCSCEPARTHGAAWQFGQDCSRVLDMTRASGLGPKVLFKLIIFFVLSSMMVHFPASRRRNRPRYLYINNKVRILIL